MNRLTDDVAAQIARTLAALQGERSDEQFAAILGCTRTHWSHLRSGRRQMSYAMAKRVSRQFPAVAQIVLRDFVSESALEVAI